MEVEANSDDETQKKTKTVVDWYNEVFFSLSVNFQFFSLEQVVFSSL